jgi:guanylate kinase
MQMGQDVILEIDWQGARQIRSLVPQAIWIFILPPSIDSLEERLLRRGQDDPLTIQKRVKAAYAELSHSTEADYIVVNDVFEKALEELRQIISVSRLRTMPQFLRHHDLVQALGIQASPDRLE